MGGGDVGTDNYWLPIYGEKEPGQVNDKLNGPRPALLLWFFDSRSGKTMISQGYTQIDDWVDPTVAAWIQDETKKMEVST